MNLVSREELKEKLDRQDDFKLVMTLPEWAFNAKHIPGSINVSSFDQIGELRPEDEIVVYCSNVPCVASQAAYRLLESNGFTKVRRYPGGLDDWETAGLPLVGEWVQTATT